SDASLKLIGKFCPHPKFAQRKEVGGKKIFVFSSCFAKKGEQARSAGNGRHEVAEVRAPRLRVGGEKIRLLCPIEVFTSLISGRGGRDRAKNYL
ncbi:MAG: hypothetical protein ABIK95_05010, partial [Acidobacteriota bacterium]